MARKTQTDTLLELCPLVEWLGPGACGGCNKDLGRATRRWCSRECERWFISNHQWGSARAACVARDETCVRCDRDGTVPRELRAWVAWMGRLGKRAEQDARHEFLQWRSQLPKTALRRRMDWKQLSRDDMEKWALLTGNPRLLWREEAGRLAAKATAGYALEVNHITPIKGRHHEYGCLHHLDNLELLCRRCHLLETQAQRDRGEI